VNDGNGAAVIDLSRVRAALAMLDAAVASGARPVPGELVAALVAVEDCGMAAPATVALGVRLPAALLARLDAVAEAQRESRNAVLLAAIEAGLPAVERQAGLDQGDKTAELVAVLRRLLGRLEGGEHE
jgi:predicted transcriptional regulator